MYSFSEGDIICREGDVCQNAFIIISGKVDVISNGDSRVGGQGEIFCGINLIRGERCRETVIASTPLEIELLSLAQLEELVSRVNQPVSASGPEASGVAPHGSMVEITRNMERIATILDKCCNVLEGKSYTQSGHEGALDSEYIYNRDEAITVEQSHLGPISALIDDDAVNDILINGHNNIYVERSGILQKTDVKFKNDAEVFDLAKNIVKDIGRKIDLGRPLVDARLLDGSRVNIIAPPLAVDGTTISIRKFSKKTITLDSMAEANNLSREVCEFLKVVGRCRLNIVISGGTGSGKTTLLNAISQHIENTERIVTIEDAAELKLQQPHVVRLETRPHHIGMKADEDVSMRDLVKNALRMRPDRIIVGEVRGPEAFDMLQAMNSGHEGSLTTIHANHPRDALSRLENMISMTDLQIPMKSLRYQIAAALHLIVQISRMRDGQRRITYISEVVGMEGDMITMHDLFNYKQEGEDANGKIVGKFKWSGIMPRFVRRIEYYGDIGRLESALGVKFPKAIQLGKPG